jgi:branched-chain amino acid transport system permease protein
MDMKRSYFEDVRLFDSLWKWLGFILLLAFLAVYPFVFGSYYTYLLGYTAINVLAALGLNILVGYTGQVSLGHGGFFGIGAYVTVLFMNKAGLPFLAAWPLAAFIAAGFGFLLGLPALRLEGPYLAIVTLGFGLTIEVFFEKWPYFGGSTGPPVPDWPISFSDSFTPDQNLYFFIILAVIVAAFAARNLIKTRVGRAFIALRDSDIAASTMGVNLMYFKTLAFAISAFFTGLAGGLFAFHLGQIDPTTFDLMLSVLFLAMVVVGGVASIFGSIMGAVLISVLNMKLKGLQLEDFAAIPWIGDALAGWVNAFFMETGMSNIRFVVYGLIMVSIMVFEPLGLYGFWVRIKRYFRTWPY